jgi:A/G-specific adenine glycosylase
MMNPEIIFQFSSLPVFRKSLLQWYDKNKRNLPWRIHPAPYRVWISEIMLQQTQVSTVIPYYIRFLKRFPDLESLAGASEQEILEFWSGLGYYHRARNLLKAARLIHTKYGEIPKTFDILISLPGIGRYTAGAICAIAFNEAQPAIDGNIRRVLTRMLGIRDRVPESHFRNHMQLLIPKDGAACFTQAMMELGALICTPSQPQCPVCPVKALCLAQDSGIQTFIPATRTKREPDFLEISLLVLEKNGEFLIISPVKPTMIPGKWGLPCAIVPGQNSPDTTAIHLSRSMLGRNIPLTGYAHFIHNISHYRICVHSFYGQLPRRMRTNDTHDRLWLDHNKIKTRIISSLFQKALNKYEKVRNSRSSD